MGKTGWEKVDGNSGKNDFFLKEIFLTFLFSVSEFNQNTVRTLLLENGTVKKNVMR